MKKHLSLAIYCALSLIFTSLPMKVNANTLTIKNGYNYLDKFDFTDPQPSVKRIELLPMETLVGSFFYRTFTTDTKIWHSGELGYINWNPPPGSGISDISADGYLDMFTYSRGSQVGNRHAAAVTPTFRRPIGEPYVDLPMTVRGGSSGLVYGDYIQKPVDEIQLWSSTWVRSDCGISSGCFAEASGSLTARYLVKIEELVKYNLDTQTFGNRLNLWLRDNFSLQALKRAIIEKVKSDHFEESSKRKIIIRGPVMDLGGCGGMGCRASIEFEGTTIFTASPGLLTYDITLSEDDDILKVPLAFTRNNAGSFIDIAFDGQQLKHLNGNDFVLDELNLVQLDVANLKGRRGNLTFTITTSGLASAEVFIPESFVYNQDFEFTALTSAVPEPEAYGMFLLGLGLIGGIARRNAMRVGRAAARSGGQRQAM